MPVAGCVRVPDAGACCACAVSAVTAIDAVVSAAGTAAPVPSAANDAAPTLHLTASRRLMSGWLPSVVFIARSLLSPRQASLHFHDVIRLPGLVEEFDPCAVEAKRHQEIPSAGGLDKVRFRCVRRLRGTEPQIDRAIAVGGDLVEAVD